LGGRVVKQQLVFAPGFDDPEKIAGLGEIILVIVPVIMGIGRSVELQGRFLGFCLLMPLPITVGVVVYGASIVSVHPHGPVPVKGLIGAGRFVDGNLIVVYPKAIA